jgi:hypothetical protein
MGKLKETVFLYNAKTRGGTMKKVIPFLAMLLFFSSGNFVSAQCLDIDEETGWNPLDPYVTGYFIILVIGKNKDAIVTIECEDPIRIDAHSSQIIFDKKTYDRKKLCRGDKVRLNGELCSIHKVRILEKQKR